MVSQAWTLSSRFCFSYLICVLFLVFFNSITCIIRFIPLIHRWKDGVIVSRRRRRQAVVWIVDVVVSFTNVLQRHFSQNPLAAAAPAQFPPQALSFCLASHFMLDPLLFCFILRYDDRVCLKGGSYHPPYVHWLSSFHWKLCFSVAASLFHLFWLLTVGWSSHVWSLVAKLRKIIHWTALLLVWWWIRSNDKKFGQWPISLGAPSVVGFARGVVSKMQSLGPFWKIFVRC